MKGFILDLKSCCVLSVLHSVQVTIMQLFLLWMMIFMFHTGSSVDLVTPFEDEILALEGDNVTLSCNYSDTNNGLFWYQQKSSSSPQHLISEYEKIPRLTFTHDKKTKEFHLQISSAEVTDSAVFYCALRLNTGSNKLFFGSGIRVNVEAREEYKPSFYKLGENNTQACLATGFSRYRENKNNSLFKNTEAIRINEDSLYNQLAFISPAQDEELCMEDEGSSQCDDALEPDPKVNLASLITLGLRLLLLKTVVFNILMTFRLWISQ